MKIKILTILSILIIGLFVLIPSSSSAQSYLSNLELVVIPNNSSVSDGYLNQTSTGFRYNFDLDDALSPDEISLFVGECSEPIDTETFDNGSGYTLSSNTQSLTELKSLLQTCSGEVSGENTVEISGSKDGLTQEYYQGIIISDFDAPEGVFTVEGDSGKKYRVGDILQIKFSATESIENLKSVEASVNGRELSFVRDLEYFSADYLIKEGDLDLSSELTLSNIKITDLAGNISQEAQRLLPIDFSLDANSPIVSITNLEENQIFARTDLTILFEASGYDFIYFYLDGKMVENFELSNLTNGNHVVRIEVSDLAGNSGSVSRFFSIDTLPPQINLESSCNTITTGSNFELSGNTDPLSRVVLYIGSKVFETYSDQEGKFIFTVNGLEQGEYLAYIEAIDALGNKSLLQLEKIVVNARQILSSKTESVVVAKTLARNDYKFTSTKAEKLGDQEESVEIAKQGKIISSTDERLPKNYTSWVLLFGIIIFSVAIASAGYYGFAWLGLGGKSGREIQIITQEERIRELIVANFQEDEIEIREEDEEDQTHLRW